MSSVSRLEVVAAAAVKKFKEMIEEYEGAPEGLKSYLLKRLRRMELRGDAILADIIEEML